MVDSVVIPLSGTALFNPTDFSEVNQLADLLFNAEEQSICLQSEHETVARAWILSALENSDLSKKSSYYPEVYWSSTEFEPTNLPSNAWIYLDNGKLIRAGLIHAKTTILNFPTLSFDQRVNVLHQICIDNLHTHVFTISPQTIQKALEWQSRYCTDKNLLTETILLLQRAANRFLLTYTDHQQTALLEPQHVAEVLVDWQQVTLADLLRENEDTNELKLFLSEHIIGQAFVIDTFVQAKDHKNLFVLAGQPYSGKRTFIEHYAQFTHGSKCFSISFDLSFFASDATWPSIFLPAPHYNKNKERLSLLEIVEQYPYAVMVLTNVEKNPVLLDRLKHEIKRTFFQIDGNCISIADITWMVLLDVVIPEPTPVVVQESIFTADTSLELSDILYRPNIRISMEPPVQQEVNENDVIKEAKKQVPETLLEIACILPFSPLTEKDKKQIVNNEIKRIIHCLRSAYNVSVYYQEEAIQFLLHQVNQANQGFEALHKNLHHHIEQVLLKSLEQGVIADGQVLMLQLNDTGRMLQIVRTHARSGTTPAKLRI